MMQSRTKLSFLLTVAATTLAASTYGADQTNLDEEIVRRAPEIGKYLRDSQYKNVGVLKFMVQKGNEPSSDNAGPLNLSLARRLEVALVLSNPDDKLGIIRNASKSVAESRRRASHLTPAGRKELFEVPFDLAWGAVNDPVRADAFVTGLVRISPDLETTTVQIQALGKDATDFKEICQFKVPTDARTLTEIGQSYGLRQISPAKEDNPAKAAKQSEASDAKHPLEASPVKWDVYYDTEKVPVTTKSGRASVRGPKQDQVVWFVLTNEGSERYGVVLRVNGENSLYREKLPSSLCRMWILDPKERVIVKGFQSDEKKAAAFQVLSPEQSEKDEVNYGEHAGTFSLEVYSGRKQAPPVATADPKIQAVAAGEVPDSKPNKLAALQDQLMSAYSGAAKTSEGRRQISGGNATGLVVAGKEIENAVEKVSFDPSPLPIVSATVRYYTSGR